MMKKIKFRAWIESQSRMERTIEISPFHVGDCDRFRWNHGEVELMQYTGLKDKNGVAVYEGDIIECQTFDEKINEKQIGTIGYNESRHGFVFTPTWMEPKNLYYPLFAVITCEVIGNIFEHPHLLETGKGGIT